MCVTLQGLPAPKASTWRPWTLRMGIRVMVPQGDAATAWKWAGVTGPFKIGLGAERAGLHTRCDESPATMRAKRVAGKRLPDQGLRRWDLRTERLERSGRSIPAQGATRICPSLADKPVMARAVLGRRNEPKVIDQDWHDDLPESRRSRPILTFGPVGRKTSASRSKGPRPGVPSPGREEGRDDEACRRRSLRRSRGLEDGGGG